MTFKIINSLIKEIIYDCHAKIQGTGSQSVNYLEIVSKYCIIFF